MVQKKTTTCDACGKEANGTTYALKLYNVETKLTLVQDLCHADFLKLVDTLGLQKIWKKWNQNTRSYENAPN